MYWVKNTAFILVALIIDLMQAGISAGLSVIAAFPGTTGGAAAGCTIGQSFLGQVGCWLGGTTLAVFGSVLNPVLASVAIPIGFALGFAINMCLSLVGGAFLIMLMLLFRSHISWNRLYWGGGELIPGINNVPFWTFFVVSSTWDGATNKKQQGIITSLAGAALTPVQSAMAAKEGTGLLAQRGVAGWTPQPEEWIARPETGEDLVNTTTQRVPIRDIRSTKPHAQTA